MEAGLHLASPLSISIRCDFIRDALKLFRMTVYVELPFLSETALQFALFRTYAIPSISRILCSTGQLSNSIKAAKRAYDTEIILREMLLHHVDSERGSYALRKLNFMHQQYKISNGDYLYTLGLFILQPILWASRYGYRNWTEREQQAAFAIWHGLGVRMGIQDIPPTVSAFEAFNEAYEIKHMKYSPCNRLVGDATIDLLIESWCVPAFLRPLARRAIYALLDARLGNAFGYPRQPWLLQTAVQGLLRFVQGTFVAWFMLPRSASRACLIIPVDESKAPKAQPLKLCPLSYQLYKPVTYPNGYRMAEVGVFQDKLASAFDGTLLCPML